MCQNTAKLPAWRWDEKQYVVLSHCQALHAFSYMSVESGGRGGGIWLCCAFLPYGVKVKHLGHAFSHAWIQDVVIGHSELSFVPKVDIFSRY